MIDIEWMHKHNAKKVMHMYSLYDSCYKNNFFLWTTFLLSTTFGFKGNLKNFYYFVLYQLFSIFKVTWYCEHIFFYHYIHHIYILLLYILYTICFLLSLWSCVLALEWCLVFPSCRIPAHSLLLFPLFQVPLIYILLYTFLYHYIRHAVPNRLL